MPKDKVTKQTEKELKNKGFEDCYGYYVKPEERWPDPPIRKKETEKKEDAKKS